MRAGHPQASPRRLIPRALAAVGTAAILAAGAAACGDSGDATSTVTVSPDQVPTVTQSRSLTPAELQVISRAQEEVSAYCRRVAEAIAEGGTPSEADFERVTAALDELAALAARAPTAETPDGTTARLALGDIAENLEGTNCDSRLVEHIDAALASLPAG